MRFGYLVPEFPGQTHTFFWREIASLRAMGMQPELVSTRRPIDQLMPQVWAREAESATAYLAPLSLSAGVRATRVLIHAALEGRWVDIRSDFQHELRRLARTQGPLAAAKGGLRLLGLLVVGAKLADLATQRDWSHVHVHSCADSAQLALFANRLSGLKYSLTLHGSLGDYGPNQLRKWQHAEFSTVITERLLREVASALGPETAARTEVVPMGVDAVYFSRQRPYVSWKNHGPARLFSCGRLNESKGHDDLVRAVGQLVSDGLDVELTIAGEDEAGGSGYRQYLELLIGETGLADRVRLLGAVSEEEVRRQLEAAHIFVLASHAEPLGVAIMEAMSMELPVVVTAGGGVSELVEDGVSGILVPSGSPYKMAGALRNVLTHPDLAWKLGRACRHRVTESFTSQRGAAALSRMIRGHGKANPDFHTEVIR